MFTLLADLTILLHLFFIAFVIGGEFLVLRRRWVAWLHVPAFLWGAIVEFSGWICPLTPLENYFRQAAGEVAYRGDFVEQYIVPLMYPDDLTRGTQLLFGALVIVVNGLIYWFVVATHDANA